VQDEGGCGCDYCGYGCCYSEVCRDDHHQGEALDPAQSDPVEIEAGEARSFVLVSDQRVPVAVAGFCDQVFLAVSFADAEVVEKIVEKIEVKIVDARVQQQIH